MNAKSLSVCMLLSAFAFSTYQVSGKSKQINRPNIIWLMAEDIGIDLGCYGVKDVKTPHLDQLAASGLRFTHCIATNSICSPSRSAMMTGVHQNKINAQHHRSNRDIPLPEQVKPFTYWLRKAGYTTILGHEKVMAKGMKIDCNFKTQAFGSYDGVENFGLFDKKLTFKEDDQPFFAQVQLKVTHRGDWWDDIRHQSDSPVDPDQLELPLFLEDHPVIRQDWAKYLDQIEYMDQEVGVLIEELKAKGMYDNTIIIFIGDNGRCNIWGKGYLHDSGIHIPLIINWPAGIPTGAIRNDLVSTTDITATILDFAKVDIPEYMTGQSFMKDDFHREYVYSTRDLWDEVMEKSRCLSSKRFRYIRNDIQEQSWDAGQAYLEFYRPALHIMRQLNEEGSLSKHASAFFDARKPHEEFYDMEKDPFELNNIIDSHEYSREIDEMRKALCAIEREYQSTDNRLNVIVPESVELLQWIKAEREDLYEQMLRGKEIGFGKLMKEFKQTRTRL